ncbi:fasciclin domain-containing protein [Nocardioides sp. CN2-186]|uniref:fasciclin domain-containing protein n=1 Tax=Nocardioides tweenelious TaxID=3156607 RepID=UPI0032B4315C
MKNRIITTTATAAVAGALALSGLAAPADAAQAPKLGNKSLAKVLAADGHRFDKNWGDFDIVDAAVAAVLKEKPKSAVTILTQGKKPVTAFLPTDAAFRSLVKSLTGKAPKTEKSTFTTLAGAADIDTIESVLLYHVVAGSTITKKQALKANGAKLTTAQGGTITVKVNGKKVTLKDADPDATNPRIVAFDVNKGNKQVGHGINHVLRPLDI